jgi:hypothetical protein
VTTFFTTTLAVTGLLGLLGLPLWFVLWRRDRLADSRNFLIAAVVVGVACGLIAANGERQLQQCLDAGNPGCVDPGSSGLQLVLVFGYTITVWVMAFVTWRE